jgi:hypothetical protein
MSTAPTRRELARALDLVDDWIRRLAKRGMPTHSVDAARAWRRVNVPRARNGLAERPAANSTRSG